MIPNSIKLKYIPLEGKQIVLDTGKSAIISGTDVGESGEIVLKDCAEETFEREEIQYPNKFWICKIENVLICSAFDDDNWKGGVCRNGRLRLMIPNSIKLRYIPLEGKQIVLDTGKSAIISGTEVGESGEIVLIDCVEETFEREEIQYPNKFWIQKFED